MGINSQVALKVFIIVVRYSKCFENGRINSQTQKKCVQFENSLEYKYPTDFLVLVFIKHHYFIKHTELMKQTQSRTYLLVSRACLLTSGCSYYEILAYSAEQMFVGIWLYIRGKSLNPNAHPSINHLLRDYLEPRIRRKESQENMFSMAKVLWVSREKNRQIIITQMIEWRT